MPAFFLFRREPINGQSGIRFSRPRPSAQKACGASLAMLIFDMKTSALPWRRQNFAFPAAIYGSEPYDDFKDGAAGFGKTAAP